MDYSCRCNERLLLLRFSPKMPMTWPLQVEVIGAKTSCAGGVEWSKYSGSIHSDIRTDEITETWLDLIKSLEEERRQEIRHRSRQSAQTLNPERVL